MYLVHGYSPWGEGGAGHFQNGRSIRTFGGGGGAPPVRTAYFMACRLRRSSMISVSGRMFFFSQSPGGSTTDCACVKNICHLKGLYHDIEFVKNDIQAFRSTEYKLVKRPISSRRIFAVYYVQQTYIPKYLRHFLRCG